MSKFAPRTCFRFCVCRKVKHTRCPAFRDFFPPSRVWGFFLHPKQLRCSFFCFFVTNGLIKKKPIRLLNINAWFLYINLPHIILNKIAKNIFFLRLHNKATTTKATTTKATTTKATTSSSFFFSTKIKER